MFLSMSVASRQPRRKPVVFSIAAMLICCFLYSGGTQVSAEPIPVHYHEGFTRAFLALTTLDGRVIASGDLLQEFKDGKVTSEMVFHFKDGSLSDETTVFTQERNFRLVSDHVIQKGPSFPHPIDMYLDVAKSEVTIRAIDKNGDKESTEHIDLPEDLANGLVIILLRNISASATETRLSMLAPSSKPRVVHLVITPKGEQTFTIPGRRGKAQEFNVHIEIGGITGAIAPIVGKQPADTHVWMSAGPDPTFIRSEGPMFEGGPIWRTQLVFPRIATTDQSSSSRTATTTTKPSKSK